MERGPDGIMTLEEFTNRENRRAPRYNNFILIFCPGSIGDTLCRQTEYFRRFQSECAELEERIRLGLRQLSTRFPAAGSPLDNDLYEAYAILKGYEVSDEDLLLA